MSRVSGQKTTVAAPRGRGVLLTMGSVSLERAERDRSKASLMLSSKEICKLESQHARLCELGDYRMHKVRPP